MIGQVKNRKLIDSLIENNKFPQVMLILGNNGSGRKTLAEYIANKMPDRQVIDIKNITEEEANKADVNILNNSIENVRKIIDSSNYINDKKLLFRFFDIDKMDYHGQNALLKILEEPRPNAIYILTGKDGFHGILEDIPATIHSRAFTINMENYSKEELLEYKKDAKEIAVNIANNIEELEKLDVINTEDLNKLVCKVIDLIPTNAEYNIYKIGTYINTKEATEAKFDLDVFLLAMLYNLDIKIKTDYKNADRYYKYAAICNEHLEAFTRMKEAEEKRENSTAKKASNKIFLIDSLIWELKRCS